VRPPLIVPDQLRGKQLIASVSGGKDSTALALALIERGLEFRAVFADTGWEHPATYEYLDMLRSKLGLTIDVVKAKAGGMPEKVRARAGFSSRMVRWCTKELKVEPLHAYHEAIGEDTVSVVGVRADESAARALYKEFEDDDEYWGGWIWRPLLRWNVFDVLEMHRYYGIAVNPLYQLGHDRVGCYPCIFARKEEIRLVAEHASWRIDEIRDLEQYANEERRKRNAEEPGRYTHDRTSYFQSRNRKDNGAVPIDDVVAWSKTARGGKHLPLLVEPPSGGCFRWGMCEAPAAAEGEGEAEVAEP
jgi:3'-phosphoadenosine 5'-phosphosulfate sulfotransferase (PAPS reductase)/FAD synthetase